ELAVAAYEEKWRERQPGLDRIFFPQVPPLEKLENWCKHIIQRQKLKAEKYGHGCGCPYASLGTELAAPDEKIRTKAQELVDRATRYVESSLTDAKQHGLIAVDDPRVLAKRVYSVALGMVLNAKIHNDLSLLEELQPSIMGLIGAREVMA